MFVISAATVFVGGGVFIARVNNDKNNNDDATSSISFQDLGVCTHVGIKRPIAAATTVVLAAVQNVWRGGRGGGASRLPLSPGAPSPFVDLTDDPFHALLEPFPRLGGRCLNKPCPVANGVQI